MDDVLLVGTILLMLVHWYAADRELPLQKLTKPGVMILLLAWFSLKGGWSAANLPFTLGLIFSLIGDSLLLWQQRFFLPGLISFLLAHVCYIIGFNLSLPAFNLWTVVFIVVVALLWLRAYQAIRRQMDQSPANQPMRLPVTVYTLVISLMILSALLCLTKADWTFNSALLVSLGGGMFLVSDFFLALQHFGRSMLKGHVLVMITYHMAQLAIIAGVVMHKI
jgi:uncharacterized membrane protein YhhN